MSTKKALQKSLKIVPPAKTRTDVMAELRAQADVQIEIAAKSWVAGDLEDCERASRYVADALKAYLENERLDAEEKLGQRQIADATSETLAKVLRLRASEGDEVAAQALKLPLPSKKKEQSRGRV